MPIRITGLNSGLDTDSIVQELVNAYRTKQEKYEKEQTKLSWKQDAWKEMNNKIYAFYSKQLSNMRMVGNYTGKKKTSVSDSTKATVSAGSDVANGTHTLRVNKLATGGYLSGSELKTLAGGKVTGSTNLGSLGIGTGTLQIEVDGTKKTVDVNAGMTVSDLVKELREQGVSANFDETNQRFFVNSNETGEAHDFNFVVAEGDTAGLNTLKALGLATDANYAQAKVEKPADATTAVKQDASDAEIMLDGMTYTSDTNRFTINGLSITATGVNADGETMSVTTETDVDGIYDMIKGFFDEYNTLVNAMESAYNADSSKGYEPLTDDEKSEMSDKEVEKWEAKIKDSLLRRDDTLSSVLSAMSVAMSSVIEVDGEKMSLSSFGINTAGYFNKAENESYAYHIDGNKDDATSGGNADRLRAAIQQDPEKVATFFSELSKKVYSELDEKMKHTETSSAYTVYNDLEMQKEYDAYSDTIKKWEEKLQQMEDYYYDKFAQMESALASLQSQQNSLSSLLGG